MRAGVSFLGVLILLAAGPVAALQEKRCAGTVTGDL